MVYKRLADLLSIAGTTDPVEVVGRYRRSPAVPVAPGTSPYAAWVDLEDNGAVLIGRFGTKECQRSPVELEELDGHEVQVVGVFLRTVPWQGAGPPPGIWTGGGPQLVDLTCIERT